MTIDKYLLQHYAPTLASLKTANMFSCSYDSEKSLNNFLEFWNEIIKSKGVELIVLKKQNNTALISVCRKSRLAADLAKEGVAEFLADYGYNSIDKDEAVNTLKGRLLSLSEFPHEIGISLIINCAED